MTIGEIIFKAIKIREIDFVFCVPGESFLATINSFYGSKKPSLISTRHEEGAGIMAEVYAKASCKTGVCIVTRGPGLAHLSIALHTAKQDSTPMVAFVGQVSTDVRYREAFQELDIVDLVRPISKWSAVINRPDRAFEIIEKAFHIANAGRPGPVVVSIPEDIDRMQCYEDFVFSETNISKPSASMEAIESASEIITNSTKPCIIAGEGILRWKDTEQLVKFAEYIDAPVFSAWRRFDAFPNNHRLYMGGIHIASIESELSYPLKKSDLVIALGTRLDEFTTMNYSFPSKNQKFIHIDQSPEETGGSWRRPDLAIISNVGYALNGIGKNLENMHFSRSKNSRIRELKVWRRNYLSKTTPIIKRGQNYNDSIDFERLYYDIVKNLNDDTSITCDAGDFASWLIRFYKWKKPYTFFAPTSGAMGYALPAAISAKLAKPKSPAIAFAGDGGFAMTMSELETAVRMNLNSLVVLVFNNSSFGTIARHQSQEFPGRQLGTRLNEINFSQISIGMGALGFSVNNNEDFFEAFKEALIAKLPAVIDIKIESNHFNAWD